MTLERRIKRLEQAVYPTEVEMELVESWASLFAEAHIEDTMEFVLECQAKGLKPSFTALMKLAREEEDYGQG